MMEISTQSNHLFTINALHLLSASKPCHRYHHSYDSDTW